MKINGNSMRKKLCLLFSAMFLSLMFLPIQAEARKFYVDNDYCFDGGCTWEGAWPENWGCPPEYDACYCNLEEAIRNTASGDTVEVAPDQFQLCDTVYINDKDNLTIRGKFSKPSIFGDISRDVMFEVYNSSNFTLENLSLTDAYSHCVHISGESNNFILKNLNIKNAYESHIKINLTSANGPFSDNGIIENCEIGYDYPQSSGNFHGADIYGINISGVKGTIVKNCIIKNIKYPGYNPQNPQPPIGWGISAKGNAQDTIIEGNIVENCGIGISFGNGGCNNACPCRNNDCTYEHRGGIIRNNVVYNTLEYAIEMNDCTDYKIYNNTLWSTMDPDGGNTTIDKTYCNNDSGSNIANNICSQQIWCRTHGNNCLINEVSNIEMVDGNNLADVFFVNQPNGDFHLKSTALQAIDKGTNSVLGYVSIDMDGDARPIGSFIDIGSDEYFYDVCTDVDKDGYYYQSGCGTEVDCDDNDVDVHPGAAELCNGIDDNCDTQVDEGACKQIMFTTGDINGDSKDDIVMYEKTLGFNWRNSATNTWSVMLDNSFTLLFVATADINGDGKDDVVVDIDGQGLYWRDSESGSRSEILGTSFTLLSDAMTADINGDGKDDIIVNIEDYGLYWRDSDSEIWTRILDTFLTLLSTTAADINGDGKDDIIVNIEDYGLYWRDSYLESWIRVLDNFPALLSTTAADINGDGKDDIIVNVEGYGLYWRDSYSESWSKIIDNSYILLSIAAADINGDGKEDIVANMDGLGLQWWNSVSGSLNIILDSSNTLSSIAGGNINTDGNEDIVVDKNAGLYWRDSANDKWSLNLLDELFSKAP